VVRQGEAASLMPVACSGVVDLLNLYGNRLMALLLQDNGGKHNQHQCRLMELPTLTVYG
jgi:hypothetical protein